MLAVMFVVLRLLNYLGGHDLLDAHLADAFVGGDSLTGLVVGSGAHLSGTVT